jgi:cell division protein FtsQ
MSDYAARPITGTESRSHRRAEKGLVALLVAAAVIALVAAAVVIVPPYLRVTRYELSGNASMTQSELLSAALIHEKEYFFAIDSSRVKAALEADPRIASATVTKLFPNGLRIDVIERRPVAVALASIQGRNAAVCLSPDGVAFAEAKADEALSVPVLSGLRFEGFRMGTRLPASVVSLLGSLGRVQASEPALLSSISEIRLVAAAGANANASEVLIYPLGHRIPVRAGVSFDAQTLRSILLVLDVLGTKGISATVQEIDFRTGTVVYRTKEGQSD